MVYTSNQRNSLYTCKVLIMRELGRDCGDLWGFTQSYDDADVYHLLHYCDDHLLDTPNQFVL